MIETSVICDSIFHTCEYGHGEIMVPGSHMVTVKFAQLEMSRRFKADIELVYTYQEWKKEGEPYIIGKIYKVNFDV